MEKQGASSTKPSGTIEEYDYSFALKKAPLDSEGYVKSFSVSELLLAREFFDEFGFMVIRDALTPKQCEDSINDVWSYVEEEKWKNKLSPRILGVKRSDSSTWDFDHGWPSSLSSEGILGIPPVFTKQALLNRMNELLFQIGKMMYDSEEIIISHDRYGLFRAVINEKDEAKMKWMTDFNIHIDMNPWAYFDNARVANQVFSSSYSRDDDFVQEFNSSGNVSDKVQMKLQALYNFIDNKEEDGGFHVIPGMHKKMKEWTEFTSESNSSFKRSNADFIPLFWKSSFMIKEMFKKENFKGIGKYAQRVTAKPGSLVVWSQFLPHGSAPNFSKNIRMAQFMKIGLATQIDMESRKMRAKYIQKKIEKAGIKIENDFQKKLMGLDVLT